MNRDLSPRREGVAEFVYGGVQAVFEIDEGVFRPKSFWICSRVTNEPGVLKGWRGLEGAIPEFLRRMPDLRSFAGEQSAS